MSSEDGDPRHSGTGRGASLRILWRSSVGAEAIDERLLPEGAELRLATSREEALAQKDWPEVLVDGRPEEELLSGERLERVVIPYAGVAVEVQERLAARPHLKLHNSHFNAPFVAQHAVALLLAVAGRIAEAHVRLREGDWRPRYDDGFTSLDLRGRCCLLVGYGVIGREVDRRVRGMGMEVAAVRRREPDEAAVRTWPAERLVDAMAEADVAVVSLPLTQETRGLIDAEALEALGPEGILVNVGRGEVVDEDALYQALREGGLFGAGLDVWWVYPEDAASRESTLPSRRPLHELPNVVMSPHRANQVASWASASFEDVAETLRAIAAGRERNRVDPIRGY